MIQLQIKCLIVFVIFNIVYLTTPAQRIQPDTSSSPAEKNVVAFYSTSLSVQLHLYNGKEYKDYPRPFAEGHPYFIKTEWSKGTVTYSGNTYSDVSILYNLVTDEVIILDYNTVLKINLVKEKVSAFSLLDHSFLNLTRDSLLSADMTAGFYDVLIKGKISLLVKRTKHIEEFIKQTMEYKVYKKDYYYLKKNNNYFSVDTKKLLFSQLSDKRKEIQQYVKQNHLRFRKDAENIMIKIVEYYNQLTK